MRNKGCYTRYVGLFGSEKFIVELIFNPRINDKMPYGSALVLRRNVSRFMNYFQFNGACELDLNSNYKMFVLARVSCRKFN